MYTVYIVIQEQHMIPLLKLEHIPVVENNVTNIHAYERAGYF